MVLINDRDCAATRPAHARFAPFICITLSKSGVGTVKSPNDLLLKVVNSVVLTAELKTRMNRVKAARDKKGWECGWDHPDYTAELEAGTSLAACYRATRGLVAGQC